MPSFATAGACPACNYLECQLAGHESADAFYLRCPNCGDHLLTGTALAQLRNELVTEDQRALRAHRLVKVSSNAMVGVDDLHLFATVGDLPSAAECLDNLVLYLASRQRPGLATSVVPAHLVASLGLANASAAVWAIAEANAAGWINPGTRPDAIGRTVPVEIRLTAKGWERHRLMLREGLGSRHAFMAMDFKQDDIRALCTQHLIAGVARTGFELRTSDHANKTAGLIDNRMRVELHTSRFVVCDLTHNNRGAYWEAGFAEGIGRPVFYLCRADVHDDPDPEQRPHFDISHQPIVRWTTADPDAAVEELVAMIRATLPGEARMEG